MFEQDDVDLHKDLTVLARLIIARAIASVSSDDISLHADRYVLYYPGDIEDVDAASEAVTDLLLDAYDRESDAILEGM